MDEDDDRIALTPAPPSEMDVPGLHPPAWLAYLLRPAVGEDPAGVGATGKADRADPLIMRSVPSGELVSTVPLVTKSTTSTGNSTGLSVWMKCPVSG